MTGDLLKPRLELLAANLAFSWLPEVRDVFRELDASSWDECDHNPIVLLAGISDDRLDRAADDEDFVRRVAEAEAALQAELEAPTSVPDEEFLVAYFSTEFAVDESLPVYSGGLGVLAGDHLKSASELGVPLVGVGLFYDRGYFRQTLDEAGWQRERYPLNDPTRLPLTLECAVSGEPLRVHLELAGEPVAIQVWRADVGRTRLYLLDTNLEENNEAARAITDRLYGGDREHRIRQEVVLGVGGMRALRLLGIAPTVFHMNEGHSAFLAVERLRELTAAGAGVDDAIAEVRASTIFTTHTPVPAGNEVFAPELVQRYLAGLVAAIGLEWEAFAALGRAVDDGLFGLTPFALRLSGRANGVSALHGQVAREMWSQLWPDRSVDNVPIGSVTNGVHPRTWLSASLASRLQGDWPRVREIGDEELWAIHGSSKRALLELVRERSEVTLDEGVLTIGFARRFATYKRATLLFSDPDRLSRLVGDEERPLQVLLAGKAHPADDGGKELIRQIWELTRDPRFAGRIAFLEDYEMSLARYLVQGVDVWLNTPRRPQEASGTSGMKAAMNGVVNCSILDGWWAEAFEPDCGFAIAPGADAATDSEQDALDAAALFDVLETEVLPAYYERDDTGIPRKWLGLMRTSIERLGSEFDTNRMVREYLDTMYLPVHQAQRTPVGATS